MPPATTRSVTRVQPPALSWFTVTQSPSEPPPESVTTRLTVPGFCVTGGGPGGKLVGSEFAFGLDASASPPVNYISKDPQFGLDDHRSSVVCATATAVGDIDRRAVDKIRRRAAEAMSMADLG